MRSTRFSGIPGRETCATASDVFPHSQVFIPLFIIFAAACLLLAGCNDEEVAAPQGIDEETYDTSSPHSNSPPIVNIWEPILGHGMYAGTVHEPGPAVQVLPGVEFSFRWNADLSAPYYPGPILFRYGWDIEDLDDNREWSCQWNPRIKTSAPRSFESGIHTFYLEARGMARKITRARVELEVIPFTRERNLLWIDDWRLGGIIPARHLPSEEEHDEFWSGICSKASGFEPSADIYEADIYNSDSQIPLSVLADYRYVIWTYSNSQYSCWKQTIMLDRGPITSRDMFRPNNFKMFLAAGGAALTCGRADFRGGLSETFGGETMYPVSVLGDLDGYPVQDAERIPYSLAHDDYYVTVIDKVVGPFRTWPAIPEGTIRTIDRDALIMAIGTGEPADLDLPDTLALDETVTCEVCFFNPRIRGFTYVEAYDPGYYMDHIGAGSHPCFTPIYRMRSRNTLSPLNGAAIALRVATGSGGHMGSLGIDGSYGPASHDSYHFGFPLWFMEHDKVQQITDEIFRSWEIK